MAIDQDPIYMWNVLSIPNKPANQSLICISSPGTLGAVRIQVGKKASNLKKSKRSTRFTSNVGESSGSRAGVKLAVVQAESDEFLETSIGLLMHDCILGLDVGKFLQQSCAAVVVVLLRIP